MSLKSTSAPRANGRRDLGGRRKSKVWTIRALEQDRVRAAPAPRPQPTEQPALSMEQKTAARTFWRRLPMMSPHKG